MANGITPIVTAVERSSRQLRPAQVQRTVERAERRDGEALPGGVDAPRPPGAAVQGRARSGQRRVKLLHLGGSVRHLRPGPQRADRHRQPQRFAHRPGGRKVRQPGGPYPMGFFTKWMEGRIDDPNAGWKGRAGWATYSTRAVFHSEGGKENRPKVVKFQIRPDPLAR